MRGMTKLQKKMILSATVMTFGAVFANSSLSAATTYTWTKDAAVTQDWADSSNWDSVGVPLTGDNTTTVNVFANTTAPLSTGTNSISTNVPATLTMNILNLNGMAATTGTNIILGTPASTFTLAGTAPTVNLNGVNNSANLAYTVANNFSLGANTTITGNGTGTFNFTGSIAGNYNLTKSGTSTLTLSSTNLYTGNTTITNGTLILGHATNTLVDTAGVTVNGAGAVLSIGSNNDNVGAVTLTNGSITGTTGVLTASSYSVATGTVSAILGGTGGLTKTTGSTVTLSGVNTYTGPTAIQAGTLSINSIANVGTASALGAPAQANSSIRLGTSGSGTAAGLTFTNTTNCTTDRVIDMLGTATYTLTQSGSGTLTFTGNFTASGSGSRTLTLTGQGTGQAEISGIISDSSDNKTSVKKLQGSTWALSGANTFSGGVTTGGGGALCINNASALGTGTLTIPSGSNTIDNTSGGAIVNSQNNPISWSGNLTFVGHDDLNIGTGNVTLATTPIVTTSAKTLTFGGNISGTGYGIDKRGTGTLVLSGYNTYTGTTNVTSGTLTLSGTNAGNSSISVNGGYTLNINSNTALGVGTLTLKQGAFIDNTSGSSVSNSQATPQVWSGNFTFNGKNDLNLGAGPVTLGSSLTLTVTAKTLTVGGAISGTGFGLTKSGSGTLILNGSCNQTGGNSIAMGTLVMGQANVFGSGTLAVNGGTFDLNGNSPTLTISGTAGSITDNNTTSGTSTLTTNTSTDTYLISTLLDGSARKISLVKSGNAVLNLTSTNNNYTGGTTVNGGELRVNILPADTTLTVTNAGSKFTLNNNATKHTLTTLSALTIDTGMVNILAFNNNDLLVSNAENQALAINQAIVTPTIGAPDTPITTTGVISGREYRKFNGDSVTIGASNHAVLDTDLVLKYAYAGDANLDGQITMDDYLLIDTGYLFDGNTWSLGDFNHDGVVNSSDYFLIDRNFQYQNPGGLSEQIISLHAAWFGAAYTDSLNAVSAIPEPTSLGLLALGTICLLRRRKQNT